MEHPIKMDDLGGTTIFGNTQVPKMYFFKNPENFHSWFNLKKIRPIEKETHLNQTSNLHFCGSMLIFLR